MTELTAPRWDLTNVYPSLDSAEFAADLHKIPQALAQMENDFQTHAAVLGAESDPAAIEAAVSRMIEGINSFYDLAGTIRSYIYSFVSTDSYNKAALKIMSEYEQQMVRAQQLSVKFESWLGRVGAGVEKSLSLPGPAADHAFYLRETIEQSK